MSRSLPPSLRQRSAVESIVEDIAPYLGTTLEERSEMMSELCRWAVEQAVAHPERRIFDYQAPRSPEAEALWLRLVRQARGHERSIGTSSRPEDR